MFWAIEYRICFKNFFYHVNRPHLLKAKIWCTKFSEIFGLWPCLLDFQTTMLGRPDLEKDYRNPNLGFATKARACEGASQEWAGEPHFMLPRMQESVREWTFTLPSELPFWELESQWIPKFSEGDCKGQNSLD